MSAAAGQEQSKARVLVVDDELIIRRLITEGLSASFDIRTVGSLAAAVTTLDKERFDLVLLDVGLPDGDGIEFCAEIRRRHHMPIIILTARADVEDVVAGLEAGADDYIAKPFRLPELAARLRAQLRRSSARNEPEHESRIQIGPLVIDDSLQDALVHGRSAGLTQTELTILKFLAARAGKAVSREAIFAHVWGSGAEHSEKILAVYIRRLRTKIEDVPAQPRLLRTVHGFGYSLGVPGRVDAGA
jgi:DNA-binding response OmpR family regulator